MDVLQGEIEDVHYALFPGSRITFCVACTFHVHVPRVWINYSLRKVESVLLTADEPTDP